jgi:hypothetical protein
VTSTLPARADRASGIDGLIATGTCAGIAGGVTIDGIDAPVIYYGGAVGQVAGMMRIDVQVPDGAASGARPVMVQVEVARVSRRHGGDSMKNSCGFCSRLCSAARAIDTRLSIPMQSGAFTQGLVFYDGYLFEGTGMIGESSIRKVELSTGKFCRRSTCSSLL